MNRHAYLIMAHTNPEQLKTLIRLLDDPRNDIYIHIDARAPFGGNLFRDCCSASKLHFISPRIRAHWGGFSLIRIEIALLEEAVKQGYSYYHLLSGMDLPIKSQDVIHDFFDSHSGKEFLNRWTLKEDSFKRFRLWTPFPEGESNFILKFLNKLVRKLQLSAGISLNEDVEFKMSSQWFSITDGMARYAVSQKSWLEKTFKHASICDEVFMATLLWRSPYRDNLYDSNEHPNNSTADNDGNLRYIDWSRSGSKRHPWVFRDEDFDLLMSVPHFWARKFDERKDNLIIDRIVKALG